MIAIRAAEGADETAIGALLAAAFGGPVEAALVQHLREHGAVIGELVAVDADKIVGHVAFSRLWVENGQRLTPAVALAPLAVAESHRQDGIAGQLIEAGHRLLADLRERLCLVVGEPAFYARFGYSREDAAEFETAYQRDYLAALRLSETAPRQGKLRYDPAFEGL